MFKPKTIRSGENLGVIDIAIRRPDFRQQPSELTSVHIENTDAVISTGVIGIWNTFNEQFRIKNCLLAAIEYDGTWNMTVDEKYVFYTIGEPYIVYVNDKMELLIQQGQGTPTRLTSGHITSISCVRGWKNIHQVGVDQGFVVAYIKNGLAYYKSYYENEEGNQNWSAETQLTSLGENLKSIRVNRSNDYRLIFTVTTINNKGIIAVTERCFGGFSVRNEYVSGSIYSPVTITTKINELKRYCNNELITGDICEINTTAFSVGELNYISACNNGLYIIELFTNIDLKYNNIHELRKYLTFVDENNNTLYYKNVTNKHGYMSFEMLCMDDVIGDITLQYKSGNGALLKLNDTDVNSFKHTFTPLGIIGNTAVTPNIIGISNTDGYNITIEFDNNISGNTDVLVYSFDIYSLEEEYVYGPTFTKYYAPASVTIIDNVIQLTFNDSNSFNNACTDVTVTYNMGRGDLVDDNGNRIKTQSVSFTPINLIQKPNPNCKEYINGSISSIITNTALINPIEGWGGEKTDVVNGYISPMTVKITEIGEIRP